MPEYRVVLPADVQPQRRAVGAEVAGGILRNRKRFVAFRPQVVAGHPKAVMLAVHGPVKKPVLAGAHTGVNEHFPAGIVAGGAFRAHFQHKIRRLAHLPHPVAAVIVDDAVVHIERHIAVRGHIAPGVALLVVNDRVAAHIRAGAVVVKAVQLVAGGADVAVLVFRVGHRFTIRFGVENAVFVVKMRPARVNGRRRLDNLLGSHIARLLCASCTPPLHRAGRAMSSVANARRIRYSGRIARRRDATPRETTAEETGTPRTPPILAPNAPNLRLAK